MNLTSQKFAWQLADANLQQNSFIWPQTFWFICSLYCTTVMLYHTGINEQFQGIWGLFLSSIDAG